MNIDNSITILVQYWQNLILKHYQNEYQNLSAPVLTIKKGKQYAKIMRDESVMAFVDIATGDLYKAATWRSPAKHKRGNCKDDSYKQWLTPYGVAHLK